ncbi:MAG: glycosyltransferase [Lachnospiraceae bacterium]|nr:glycosyltransferase [Lachnospiraceae bacterium]
MLVSIITVAYNSEKTIAKTIESVLNQTYSNIEYIIVDGMSKDKTADIARAYIPMFEAREGRSLKVISEPDRGMYDALNKGARLAYGEIVGQINADDWYEIDAVEKMATFYEKEHYNVAWGNLNVHKPSGDMIKRAKIGRLWTTSGWCHPAMFSQKDVLLEFPYACENMYDDFEFVTRVYLAKKKICTLDEVISNFNFGGMSTKKNFKDAMRRVELSYGIYKKHGMSRFYWFHRFAMEMAKYILG